MQVLIFTIFSKMQKWRNLLHMKFSKNKVYISLFLLLFFLVGDISYNIYFSFISLFVCNLRNLFCQLLINAVLYQYMAGLK